MCFPPYIEFWDFFDFCYGEESRTLIIDNIDFYGKKMEDFIKDFPGTVENLIIKNCILTNISIPKTVKKLRISDSCIYANFLNLNKSYITNKIKSTNEKIKYYYEKKVVDNILIEDLPDDIEVMNISTDCYVEKYPKNLKDLIITPNFSNHKIFNVNLNFPKNLLKLCIETKIPKCECHSDKNILVLPPKLTHLDLVKYHDKIIYNESLQYLTVKNSKTFDFINIPPSVENIGIDSNNPSIDALTNNIKRIRIFAKEETDNISNLPISIKKAYIDYYSYSIDTRSYQKPIDIKLPFDCNFQNFH